MDINKDPKKSDSMVLVEDNPASNEEIPLTEAKQDSVVLLDDNPVPNEEITVAEVKPDDAKDAKDAKPVTITIKNPYKMPSDIDIFEFREKERSAKKKERAEQKKLKVYEKTTYTRKIKSLSRLAIKKDAVDEDEKQSAVKDDYTSRIPDVKIQKETLNSYMTNMREMFRLQYSIDVMRAEMRKLDEISQAEERKLEMAEHYLEEDASTFEEFLKENDKNSTEAAKIAELETKEKLEKLTEIKKINTNIMTLKSDIAKSEDTLKEYKLYKNFLESISPKEWSDKIRQKREEKGNRKKLEKQKSLPDGEQITTKKYSRKFSIKPRMSPQIKLCISDTESISSSVDSDSDEEQELYFKDPQEVLDIFSELEEQNLTLIQNSQETEVALEEAQRAFKEKQMKMDNEAKLLQDQIKKAKAKIRQEMGKSEALETKVNIFATSGDSHVIDQQSLLNELNKKVEQVYRGIIGSNELNIDTLQMLNNIENRLEELFEHEESLPVDKVEAARKRIEKERRVKMKEEKLKLHRKHQEERIKKSLERSRSEPKKITGKRLIFRSEPPQLTKKQDKKLDHASREEEELAYFFTA